MNNIAIIPARGGSKRIPRKNIKDFLGKPIIAYSIETAIKSQLFSEVMVSTDDNEIAEIATRFGAKIPFMRSSENAKDEVIIDDTIREVIAMYQQNGQEFDNICCIFPCAPLVTAENLQNSYQSFVKNKYDLLFPVIEYSHPIQRALEINENGKIAFINEKNNEIITQSFQNYYYDAGQYYWMTPDYLRDKNRIENSGAVIISALDGQDIDNEDDWAIAEIKYKLKQSKI